MAKADLMSNLVPIGVGAGLGVGGTWVTTKISKSLTEDAKTANTPPKDVAIWRKAPLLDLVAGGLVLVGGYFVRNDAVRKGMYSGGSVLAFNGLKDLVLDLTAEDVDRTWTGRPRGTWDNTVASVNSARRLTMAQGRFANANRLPSGMSINTEATKRSPASLF